ncbi:MAG TPA: hypothetical protein PLP33_27155 [Leptospiraceae bacterium]|nr:hypothetical protein [Leptospiraceae bacterium]
MLGSILKNILKGKRFGVKLHMPMGAWAYFRLYYTNSYGILWKKIKSFDGQDYSEIMLSIGDREKAIAFAKKFQTIKDVKNFKEKEYSEYLKMVSNKTINVV